MKISIICYTISVFVFLSGGLSAADRADLASRFKQLPTVPENELPELKNKREDFRGEIGIEGLRGHTWVAFPFVENPGSFGFDRKGRLFVAEANRFWLGVPDLRGANEMVPDDFKAVTVDDRLEMYEKFSANFPEGWFSAVADRIIRLEDRDGNGAADHRTLFSDHFSSPADGIGFSILADEDGVVYFTCIPKVWKLTDENDDGVADAHEAIADGFGVRVSFIGHDLHGITRGPDGMLYFSVGDRSYHLKDSDGNVLNGAGRGAIFRCESDGSGLERFCTGLRNPQELAFDDLGNLFTFDNTGDIGDKARMVYALQGTDSGWNMAHQSAHHYVEALDWGNFHPEKSMWVAERMFDTHNEEQPQWVYPPASHVAEGPSGVTFLTGSSLPESMRDRFLLSNYRGAASRSTSLLIDRVPEGAGYRVGEVVELVKGVAASDVELGYDGKIYLCDFGGGWSVNTNGSIQVIESEDEKLRKEGDQVARIFKEGFRDRESGELITFLSHVDKRVRQASQFALVEREEGATSLREVASEGKERLPRLHAIWGLGQIMRERGGQGDFLLGLIEDSDPEVRASVVRVLGDSRFAAARQAILRALKSDSSLRVRSLAAIAIGRVCDPGDRDAIDALYDAARQNGEDTGDIVLRHAILSGLERVGTEDAAAGRAGSDSEEERLLAVLYLRRQDSTELARFLGDSSPLILRETIRAIYDTDAVDMEAGAKLADFREYGDLSETLQRRIVATNYRRGGLSNGKRMLEMASEPSVAPSVARASLVGLLRWEDTVETDPVLGHYRPVKSDSNRSMAELGREIGVDLREFLADSESPELTALAIRLADSADVDLPAPLLMAQVKDTSLDSELRAAALESLVESGAEERVALVEEMLGSDDPTVGASAMKLAFEMGWDMGDRAFLALRNGAIPVAREAIRGMATQSPERWLAIWSEGHEFIRPELKLDGYLATRQIKPELADSYAAGGSERVFRLSEFGGDPLRGEKVYLNQGGCRQCHKIGRDGGVQGPDLTRVAERLSTRQLLTSVYNPMEEISPGYGTSSVTLKSGEAAVGRLARENKSEVVLVSANGEERIFRRDEIASMTPPVSAMPPMGAVLSPEDLRDLVAYLAGLRGKGKKGADGESHGDEDEAIAK